MLPELRSLCRSVVQVAVRSCVDGYGQPVYGPDVAHRARVVDRARNVLNFQGELVLSAHTVYFADAGPVGQHDRVTLSTGDVNSTEPAVTRPPLLNVLRAPDDFGRVALTVYLG